MSAKTLFLTTRAYFLANWETLHPDIPLSVPEQVPILDTDNLNKYIRFSFIPNGSGIVGTNCTEEIYGYVKIDCYHKNEILSVDTADKVKTFFDNNYTMSNRVTSKDGQIERVLRLDNDIYVTTVLFSVEVS